jgi:ParB family chromosome partitioning protein
MTIAAAPREFKELPVGLIDEPELPSRSQMDDAKLDELVASIKAIGLQQPIVVARVGERFEVIAGHRRRIACGRANLAVMPCVVYASKDDAQEAIKFAENYNREELNPADEAIWFSELLERKCGGDVDVLAAMLSVKRSYIDGRLLLFQGCHEVFEALRAGKVSIGVAQELNKITAADYRHYYLTFAIRDGATIATVAGYVQQWRTLFADVPPRPETTTAPAVSSGVAPTYDPMRCHICGKSDHRIPEQISVHSSCREAILDVMLENARRGGE